jgi:16S rRNA (cytidine1402-2'-O)-methyltransferase
VSGGVLYVVATPIGNLEDVTLRALRVLREVDLIAAEDTRHTRKLLEHHGIRRPLTSYHDAVERQRAPALVARLVVGASICAR